MKHSFCGYYNRGECRSCAEIEIPLQDQIRSKEAVLKRALSFFGTIALESTVTGEERGFRNRAKMAVTGTLEEPRIGLIGEIDYDLGQDLVECAIHHPELNRLFSALPQFIRDYRLIPYRIADRTGELKSLIAFYSPESREMYLRFVLRSQECVARLRKALPALTAAFPALVCISANIQPIPHALLEGPEEIFITEKKSISHRMGALSLSLAPQAFVQTNTGVATELYATAAKWIAEAHVKYMLELYCGQGAFSFFAAESAREILGVDISEEAVATAARTAAILGLGHLSFRAFDATKAVETIAQFREGLVLVNPPRSGLREGAEHLRLNPPKHIVYSSCAHETLATDLEKLSSLYSLKRVRIFDLFPHTAHFETLVWLERRAEESSRT